MAEMILPKRDRESVSASIEINDISELMFGNVLEVDPEKKTDVDYTGKRIHVYLRSNSTSGICPFCDRESSCFHSKGFRHPQWMPIQGMATYAHIELNRYKCLNELCPVKTFTEEPDNVRRNQHRSYIVYPNAFLREFAGLLVDQAIRHLINITVLIALFILITIV